MKPIEYFRFAFKSLWSRKLRSSLTIIGVSIGIGLYVVLLSQTQGLYESVVGQIKEMGVNNIFLFPLRSDVSLSIIDVNNLRLTGGVSDVVPVVRGTATLTFGGTTAAVSVTGIDFSSLLRTYPGMTSEDGEIPAFPGLFDTLVGHSIAYPPDSNSSDPLIRAGDSLLVRIRVVSGRQVLQTYRYFTVSAVLSQYGISVGGVGPDVGIFIPIEVADSLFNRRGTYNGAIVVVDDVSRTEEVSSSIQQLLGGRFSAISPESIIQNAQTILNQIQFFLGAIAAVSLVVSGVGIANIMYISVIERVKIIGLYKALGMRKLDVAALYVVESGLIGFLGGVFGILIGVLVSAFGLNILPINMPNVGQARLASFVSLSLSPTFTPELFLSGMGIALFVSIVAGLYPAYKASQLEAAQALKYE